MTSGGLAFALAAALDAAPGGPGAALRVDGFEDASRWEARPADGVDLAVRGDPGVRGRALRLDFRFRRGGGYAVVRRVLPLELPENYRFRLRVRGACPPENLEFKLVDGSGENVWWVNRRDFHFPAEWDTLSFRKRHIQFAWGPAGGGEIRRVAAIEVAVTAGSGGEGTVWLDELELEPLPLPGSPARPVARGSSARRGFGPERALDGDTTTAWASAARDPRPWLALDFGAPREYGGLTIRWAPGRHPSAYVAETSEDAESWRAVREVRAGNGGRDDLYLPESESRRLRLRCLGPPPGGVAVQEVVVRPLEWSASLASFLQSLACEAPRGRFPRALSGEQPYWTVVGVDGDRDEALLGEDGVLETGKASFSIEPFLLDRGRLVGWADGPNEASLEAGYLPIPTVRWRRGELELEVTAFAQGDTSDATVVARYLVANRGSRPTRPTLFLALRPFQVNPPQQFLNTPGGAAPIRTLRAQDHLVRVNQDRCVMSLTPGWRFGAASFDEGEVTEYLEAGRLPPRESASDPSGLASGALAFALDLPPGAAREVDLLVPLHGERGLPPHPPRGADPPASAVARNRQAEAARRWETRLSLASIRIPDREVARTLRAQVAWILIHRDGPALQPGSRSYERSWIRDGALTSSALLRLGHAPVVREFIEWFAPHQYEDGKVPCCVDRRGADPVPEHDSAGELVFLVAEYFRHTGDRATAERAWPAVGKAAAYLDSLRRLRRTGEYLAAERRHFFGLLPPSISHEGYSAKPMHSYWDDFFALRGFKDAAFLAGALGRPAEARRWAAVRDEFARDLAASIAAAMDRHGIDFIPGCADLGDFDATSTTIVLSPAAAGALLPAPALERTFARYWDFFRDRRDGRAEWDAFTPYEVRLVGTFVRLGWRSRATELLAFFMEHRRPAGWAQWAEVVGRDPRAPRFIGDMPHGWVGSDFVRSVLDMLAYEREEDESLVLGAGVPWEWLAAEPGVVVRDLSTRWGRLGFEMRAHGDTVVTRIAAGTRVPQGGIVVIPPASRPFRRATVEGRPAVLTREGALVVRTLPAMVTMAP